MALQSNLPVGRFNSGACEALARCGWHIYVRLPLPRWLLGSTRLLNLTLRF